LVAFSKAIKTNIEGLIMFLSIKFFLACAAFLLISLFSGVSYAGKIDVRSYGALGDGKTNDTFAIRRAIDYLSGVGGGQLYFPEGRYLHDDILVITSNISLLGEGEGSILIGTNPSKAAIIFDHASHCSASMLVMESSAIKRSNLQNSADLVLNSSHDCLVSHIVINGSASAGILVNKSNDVEIVSNKIRGTLADGIHVVGGASKVLVSMNYAENTGDDSFSAVAYSNQTPQTSDVTIADNIARMSHARGISCIGALNCVIKGNQITDARGHGIAVAYEQVYNSYHPRHVDVENNKIWTSVPTRGTNSILVSGAEDVLVKNNSMVGGNPVLVTESDRVVLRKLSFTNFEKFVVYKKGRVNLISSDFELNGVKVKDVSQVIRDISR
jgi:hypothetical protein